VDRARGLVFNMAIGTPVIVKRCQEGPIAALVGDIGKFSKSSATAAENDVIVFHIEFAVWQNATVENGSTLRAKALCASGQPHAQMAVKAFNDPIPLIDVIAIL
jgi:hypothetical protein